MHVLYAVCIQYKCTLRASIMQPHNQAVSTAKIVPSSGSALAAGFLNHVIKNFESTELMLNSHHDWMAFRSALSVMHQDVCRVVNCSLLEDANLLCLFSNHTEKLQTVRDLITAMTNLLKSISGIADDTVIERIITLSDEIKLEFQSLRGTYDALWLRLKGTKIH